MKKAKTRFFFKIDAEETINRKFQNKKVILKNSKNVISPKSVFSFDSMSEEKIVSIEMPAKQKSPRGEQRLVECQSKCGNRTNVWIPEKSLKRSFISGISVDREKNDCNNSNLKDLEVSIKTESITRIGS